MIHNLVLIYGPRLNSSIETASKAKIIGVFHIHNQFFPKQFKIAKSTKK